MRFKEKTAIHKFFLKFMLYYQLRYIVKDLWTGIIKVEEFDKRTRVPRVLSVDNCTQICLKTTLALINVTLAHE